MILSVAAFAFLVADQTDRLQQVAGFLPPKYAAYLPVAYGTFFVVALMLLNSAHKDDIEALRQPPDVRLEGTFPGAFALHAYGHACEIRTGPIIIEKAVIAVETHGDEIMQVWNPRCSIEFPVVSDLRDAAKPVEPSLFYDEGYTSRHRWPDTAPEAVMKEFFHAAKLARRGALPDLRKLSPAELDALAERHRQPYLIAFDITFWNVEHTRQWKRSELLVYEPPPSDTAFVRHSGEPVLTNRSETARTSRFLGACFDTSRLSTRNRARMKHFSDLTMPASF